jgi:vanillate O-demethylase monooxygenase subunit
VARSADVTEHPVGIVLLGDAWVLHRSGGDAAVVAFVDRCPHRHCPLSLGRCVDGVLQCAYHGWRFDRSGICQEIPALGGAARVPPAARLTPPAAVAETHGIVFIAPEEPIAPLGSVHEAEDDSFMEGKLPTLRARASAGLLADNFLDVAHFPFVHVGTFGADEASEVPPFCVDRDGWTFTASYEHLFAHREDPGVAAGLRPLVQTRRLTYRLVAPFHLTLRIDFVDSGGTNVIGFFIQPESEESCRLFTTLWRDDLEGDEGRMREAVEFELAVLREDLHVQEAYHELVLPLDPRAEVHTRADRSTLELRRVLADLVDAATG